MNFDLLLQQGSSFFIRIISAIVVLLLGLIIGKLSGRFIQKVLAELEVNVLFRDLTDIRLPLDRFAGSALSFAIYAITIVFALQQLKIITSVIYLILGALTLLLGATLLVGIKDFFPNTLAYFELRKRVSIGDQITFKTMRLKITTMNLLETQTENNKGEIIFFPNAQILRHLEAQKRPKKRQ